MKYRIESTVDWDFDQLAPYTKQITAYFKKLVDRFPDDVTVESLGRDCVTGARQMWLVFNDKDDMVAVFLTSIRIIEATDTKIVTATTLGGDEGLPCVPDIARAVEDMAARENADFIAVEGRRGWSRALKTQGYKEHAVVWRKPVERSE